MTRTGNSCEEKQMKSILLYTQGYWQKRETQIRMSQGNFHRDFCFSSVKLIFLYSLCWLSGRTDYFQSSPENCTVLHCFVKGPLPSGDYRTNTSPFFPLGMCVVRLKQHITITNTQLFIFQYIFPQIFLFFLKFLCQRVLQTGKLGK